MSVHTRTHVYVTLANPHLQCDLCRASATAWHDAARCGCGAHDWIEPCGHPAGLADVCPSWSPVDGCQCLGHFGSVDHGEPPAKTVR